jgi:tetratricopeptide (TPR) repeat protein
MDPILANIDAAALLDEAILYLEAEGLHNWSLRCKHARLQHAIGTRPPTPLDAKAADELSEEFGSLLGPTHSWTIASLWTKGRAWYYVAEDYPQTVHIKETEPDLKRRAELIRSDRNKYYRYSLEAYQYLLQQTTVRYGMDHVFTASAGIAVGQQLMLLGDPEEGRPYYVRGIERRSKYAGPNTEILMRIKTGYGVCLMNCGDYEAAAAHYEKHWQDCAAEERLGPGHAITIVAHRGYHHALGVLGRADRIREDSSIQWDSAKENFLSARTLLWEDLQYSVIIELSIGPDHHVVDDIEERWQQLCQSWSDHPLDERHAEAWKDIWKPQLEESMGILRAVSAGDEAALAACFKESSFFSSDHHLSCLARIQALRLDRVALEETLTIAETGENKHLVDQVRAEIAVLDLNAGDPTSAEDLLKTLTSKEQIHSNLARRLLLWALNQS